MTQFFLLLLRLIVLAFSFALSTLAAALFVTFVLFLDGDASWLQDDPAVIGASALFTLGFWFQIATLTLVPASIVIVVMEIGRFSSFLLNLVAGGICAAIVVFSGMAETAGLEELPYEQSQVQLTMIAAGFGAGLIHWLVAGHRAGRWMGPRAMERISDPQ